MMHRTAWVALFLIAAAVPATGIALSGMQLAPDLFSNPGAKNWLLFNRQMEALKDGSRPFVRLDEKAGDGAAWLTGIEFATGTLEVDIRGKNQQQRSFVGIAFHGADDKTYEAVYFRPFNFRSEEAERRSHSVQYISHPENTWQRLRSERPLQFEQPVKPVPDPDGWFHARVEITGARVRVFVDGSPEPSLDVARLTDRSSGRIGLWVGNTSGGDFAGLRLIPGTPGNASPR